MGRCAPSQPVLCLTLQGTDTSQGTPVDLVVMDAHPTMGKGAGKHAAIFLFKVDFINEMNLMWSIQLDHMLQH